MESLKALIHETFLDPKKLEESQNIEAINQAIHLLDKGKVRIAEKIDGEWKINEWLKEAVLLYFRITKMEMIPHGPFEYYDKIPLKQNYEEAGVRVVPPATVRKGAFVEKGAILMPSYVNIGAYVGAGTMVDTWATVGSCAQIGKNVHLSGGVGIGGVLEPLGARPVIIEDDVFVGSRSIIVEGVLVEEKAVIAANVTLTASTDIIDVTGEEPVTYRGRVPKNSVVIPGSRTKHFPAGDFQVNCALIIGQRKRSTNEKTALNQTLREFGIA